MTATTSAGSTTAPGRLDPVVALLAGRTHYRRPVPPPRRGEPTLAECLVDAAATCEVAMVPVPSGTGAVIGFRCPACGTTASPEGRTEHGPRWEVTRGGGTTTVIVEPGHEDAFLASGGAL